MTRLRRIAAAPPTSPEVLDLSNDAEWHDVFYGTPSDERVRDLAEFLRANRSRPLRLYHGTWAGHPVPTKGLLPTSARRARSLQSAHGYVYLSVYPGMARTFAEMAYPRQPVVVYAVDLPIKKLLPDHDQLRNRRLWDPNEARRYGATLADSLAHGHGARVRGRVDPAFITVVERRTNPPRSPELEVVPALELLLSDQSRLVGGRGATARIVARVAGVRPAAARAALTQLTAARVLRQGVVSERDKLVEAWSARRRGAEVTAARVIAGLAPMPDPRPFLGDEDEFIMPPRPAASLGLVVSWRRPILSVAGPGGAFLVAEIGRASHLGEGLDHDGNHCLAEVFEEYGRTVLAYVDDVQVPEEMRGRGIGRSMVAAALWWLAEKDVVAAFLHAFPLDDDMTFDELEDFYRDAGMHYYEACGDHDLKPVYWFDLSRRVVRP